MNRKLGPLVEGSGSVLIFLSNQWSERDPIQSTFAFPGDTTRYVPITDLMLKTFAAEAAGGKSSAMLLRHQPARSRRGGRCGNR